VLESVARVYLDPLVVGGFSNVTSYLALIAFLFVRPRGLFGQPAAERV
jgi:branched-subunit amino acid ABC-type transport system permease component